MKTRLSNPVSRRSVFARQCSRETATLVGWMTSASISRALSQRASQNPSRPASNATTMRVIVRPFWVASARQRINNRSKSPSLGSSFFSGWRSIPGTMPATSPLAWLISMTAMIVLSCFRGVRDRLRSSSCCAMGRSIALLPATMVTSRHRLPHSISGETFWSVSNGVSKPFFAGLLALFAREAGAGRERMIVLGLDNAGWHSAPNLIGPDGIRLGYLPPYSPELQPAEHLWPVVDEPLANQDFATLADLEQVVTERCRVLNHDQLKPGTNFRWWPSQTSRPNQPESVMTQ